MDTEIDLLKTVVKFVSGGEYFAVCRLCLVETKNSEPISLEDDVNFDKPYFKGGISYDQMLLDLEVPKESSLPFLLCPQCALQVTEAFLFQKLVQNSNKKWAEVLNKINNALDLSSRLRNNVQTAYFLMEEKESHLFTSHKNSSSQTKQTILDNVKTFLRQRKAHNKVSRKKKHKTTLICEECGNSFPSKSLLSKHILIKHKAVPYKCKECKKEFKKSWYLKEHIERMHKKKRIQCSSCAKMLGSERLLKMHTAFEHKAVLCQVCFIQLGSKKELKQHMVTHGKPSCTLCGKLYANNHSLNLHKKNCGKPEKENLRFYCAHCSNNYKTKNALRTHLKIDHGFMSSAEAIHKCDWCDRKFDVISRLKSHIVKHTKEKNFHCESCGGSFVTKAALTYHTRLHTGEKPFKCDMCDESFLSSSRRMEHKRRKHFGPERQCEECGRKFLTGYALRKHVARHTNPQSKLFLGITEDRDPLLDHCTMVQKTINEDSILVKFINSEIIM